MTTMTMPVARETQPSPAGPPVDEPIRTSRLMLWFSRVLLFALAAFALFDRGYAWVHVPGTPVFTGELIVALGIGVILADTKLLRRALSMRIPSALLIAFMVWGLLRTVPMFGKYQLDAVRDAALWYYALVAIPVAMLVLSRPELPERWLGSYRKLIPWLLFWSFPALQMESRLGLGAPQVPDSNGISIFSHKPSNVAVHAGIVLAFLWLVPFKMSRLARGILTSVSVLAIGIAGTQSRSGLVAGVGAMGLVFLLTKHRRQLVVTVALPLVIAFALAWSLNLQVPAKPRPISVTQLVANVTSLNGGGNTQLADNVEFRDELWTTLIKETVQRHKLVSGWGFGPNLALEVGFEGDLANPLRSPHNSHLDILARMGIVGTVLWAGLWTSWYGSLLFERFRLQRRGRRFTVGLMDFAMVGTTLIMVNAYFDPSLEGAQVAVWLWTLFGLGLGLVALERIRAARPTAPRHEVFAGSATRSPIADLPAPNGHRPNGHRSR